MAEQDDVVIKVIATKKIPIDKIKLSNIQARQIQVTKSLEVFAEQIRKIGLIQPVVVYQDGDGFELIVGQRRYYAHKDVLKWSEIFAMIIEKPENDMMSTTISWLENEARQKMSNKDTMRHVANMYAQKMTISEIAETLGIRQDVVKACIALPRVPDVVRKAVEAGEIDPKIAVRATDAKKFEKYETSEDKGNDVLDLAKLLQSHKLSVPEVERIVDFGKENPDADNQTLITEGIKKTSEILNIDISSSNAKRLDRYAKNNDFATKNQAAASLILDGLDQSGD